MKSPRSSDVIASSSLTRRERERAIRDGSLLPISRSIDLWLRGRAPEEAVAANQWRLLAALVPSGVVGYRTAALDCTPGPDGLLVVTDRRVRTPPPPLVLPGRIIRRVPGYGPLEGDVPFHHDVWWGKAVWRASAARAWLECCQPSRHRQSAPRSLPRPELYDAMVRWCERVPPDAVARTRAAIPTLALKLGVAAAVADELVRVLDDLTIAAHDVHGWGRPA